MLTIQIISEWQNWLLLLWKTNHLHNLAGVIYSLLTFTHVCRTQIRFLGGEVTDSVLLPFLFLKLITTHITKTCAFLTFFSLVPPNSKSHVCSTPISSQIIWSIVAQLCVTCSVAVCGLRTVCVTCSVAVCGPRTVCVTCSVAVCGPRTVWQNNNSLYVHRLTEDLSMCMS